MNPNETNQQETRPLDARLSSGSLPFAPIRAKRKSSRMRSEIVKSHRGLKAARTFRS